MKFNQFAINICYILKNISDILILKREKAIANILIKNNLTVSISESCTGGLISSRMTDVSGSSAYIHQNLVTYANSAKIGLLGVKDETIQKYGVVSEETALEMAKGLLKNYDCNISLSTTGIAGPFGGTSSKPVGMLCIAIANKYIYKTYTYKANPLLFRRLMKYDFSNKVLDYLLEFLLQNY